MITKDMRINKVLREYPETAEVFEEFGLDCTSCMRSRFESLEQITSLHGTDIVIFLDALNETVEKNRQ